MLTSMTGHDSVLLRADDPLIDMNYITSFTGMTDKWFYKLISEGHFLNPSNWGAAAAGTKVKWSSGCSNESRHHEGSSMKRVVMPVRWQCAKYQRWYCGNQPCPLGAGDLLPPSVIPRSSL